MVDPDALLLHMTQQNIVHEGLIRGQKMNHVYQAHTLDVIRTTGNNNVALRMKSADALSQRCSRLKNIYKIILSYQLRLLILKSFSLQIQSHR